jgi:hypothetical protein
MIYRHVPFFGNLTFRHVIDLKNQPLNNPALDLAKLVPDEAATLTLLLKEISHEHLCWRQNT